MFGNDNGLAVICDAASVICAKNARCRLSFTGVKNPLYALMQPESAKIAGGLSRDGEPCRS